MRPGSMKCPKCGCTHVEFNRVYYCPDCGHIPTREEQWESRWDTQDVVDRLRRERRDLDERMERVSLAWQAFEGGRDANGMELLSIALHGWKKHEDSHG